MISLNRWEWNATGTRAHPDLFTEISADSSNECAYIDTLEEGDWVIYDTPCDIQRHFVCEFDLNAEDSDHVSPTGNELRAIIINVMKYLPNKPTKIQKDKTRKIKYVNDADMFLLNVNFYQQN